MGEDFPESVKHEARVLAAFKCCICHDRPGDHVHHVIPKADGGPDDLDNAAFLCAQCHTDYGTRSEKRKFIRECRDWWYDRVRERYSRDALDQLTWIQSLATKDDISGLRDAFDALSDRLFASVEVGSTSTGDVVNIASTMVSSIAPPPLVDVTRITESVQAKLVELAPSSRLCARCGTAFSSAKADVLCPNWLSDAGRP